ncbi:hypothetical protein [Rhodobacter maris]|uniref:Uncharacterized protein n=1 Tax=Rhodobacter maris TaxID=446682 RepID=A0A285TC13_9RHOB|nr:hypothetical protein [Rhodobacter maris]SOC19513.1 hypothetical protein SAMN05877831_1184 [Rhodobacter maris]
MATQFSTRVRNAALNAIETTIGAAPTLELRTGAPPASAAATDTGTLLASMTLPSDWMADAAAGAKTILGTWQDSAADAAGTVGHYRIKAAGACDIQGTVTITGGGGDMTLDNPVLAVGQQVTITAFTLTAGGA